MKFIIRKIATSKTYKLLVNIAIFISLLTGVMLIFYEILKIIFFISTILVGLFYARWEVVFDVKSYQTTQQIIMPWYLVICWIMIGYFIGSVWLSRYDEHTKELRQNQIFTTSLILWLILGIVLAIINIFYVI